MKISNLILFITIFTSDIYSQNELPIISHLRSELQNNLLTISFDVSDTDNPLLDIQCRIYSLDAMSLHQEIQPLQWSGDIGFPIVPGLNKKIQITLDPMLSFQNIRVALKVSDREPLNIQEILNQVDTHSLRMTVMDIQGKRNNNDKPFYEFCRNYLFNRFDKSLFTRRLDFTQGNISASNFECTQYGFDLPSEITVIDAHYDSFGNSPGADDNASGVAGVLEAHRLLSNYCSKSSLRYLLFDLEEAGLIGSLIYVSNQVSKRETIANVLNYEMIGFYTESPFTQDLPVGFNILFPEAYNKLIQNDRKGNFITNVANTSSSKLKTIFETNAATYVPALNVISLEVPGNGSIAPDLRRSDHASFWDKAIPALMLTDGANFRNKKYHTSMDSFHLLNFNFMSNVIKTSIATAIELCKIEHATCKDISVNLTTSTHDFTSKQLSVSYLNHNIFIRTRHIYNNCKIKLFNMQGTVLLNNPMAVLSQKETIITCPNIQPGIYFLQLESNGSSYLTKFIVHDN